MPADSAQHRVKDLFNEAVERPPGERPAFLDSACGDDPDLRGQVERLLAALDDAPDFLETPPATDDFELDADGEDGDSDLVGSQISHYQLQRLIATGGMGSVYEAVQEKPHRTVAVKVMKRGIASRSALRRFEHESQILARLRHPSIAQVYEAGTWASEGDVPYFVMEYVPGARPITEYAREHKLTTSQRMELFASVCGAVHHGHQKGIIHRDLKPANILIDVSGEPKIIDFGVARATDSDVAVTTLHTDVGQLIGTLQYMSPEQCQADPNDLDTRSDVYALGVVLYELLSEHLPYDITHAPVPEAIRVVKEEAPARPSSVNKTLRGDIETILLKALEKERDRRYSSAADLAADITRYLTHEPIVARPPSATYQLRKFAQRHKGLATGFAAVFVVLVAASVVSTVLYLRAEDARAESARQAAIAEAVNEFLNDDLLAAVSPEEQGREVTMREVLDVASKNIDGKFPDEPLIEAAIRATLGSSYWVLGRYELAELHLTEAHRLRQERLGDKHPDTLDSIANLAIVYSRQGRNDEAELLFLQTLEIHKRALGEEHLDTLASMRRLAAVYREQGRDDKAEQLILQALEITRRVHGEQHPHTILAMHILALEYRTQGRYTEAEPLFRQALEMWKRVLGEEHPKTLHCMSNFALLYFDQGRYVEAEQLNLQTLEIRKRVLGTEHPDTLASMINLTSVYAKQGRHDETEPLRFQTLEIHRRVLGGEHPQTLEAMTSLASTYFQQARYDEAELLYLRALEIKKRVLGDEHRSTLTSMRDLADTYTRQDRYDDAEPLFLRAIEIQKDDLGQEHPGTLHSMNNLAALYYRQGRYDEAERLFLQTLDVRRRVLGEEHPSTLQSMGNLAVIYLWQGRHEEAASLEAQSLEIEKRIRGEEHPETLISMNNLGATYILQGRYDEAEPLCLRTLAIRQRVLGEEHPQTLSSMNNLADLYSRQGRYTEAEPLYVETLDLYIRVLGAEHSDTLALRHDFANMYKYQGRYDEAESLFLQTIEIRERVLGGEHPKTLDSMSNLADMYADQSRHEDAEPLLLALVDSARTEPGNPETGTSLLRYGRCLLHMARYEEAEHALREANKLLSAVLAPDEEAIRQSIAAVASLYDAWDKSEMAAEWRAKLEVE